MHKRWLAHWCFILCCRKVQVKKKKSTLIDIFIIFALLQAQLLNNFEPSEHIADRLCMGESILYVFAICFINISFEWSIVINNSWIFRWNVCIMSNLVNLFVFHFRWVLINRTRKTYEIVRFVNKNNWTKCWPFITNIFQVSFASFASFKCCTSHNNLCMQH